MSAISVSPFATVESVLVTRAKRFEAQLHTLFLDQGTSK